MSEISNLRNVVKSEVACLAEREEAIIVMETGDHLSNGVSPKDPMSRGSFFRKVCAVLLAAIFIFSGCSKDNGDGDDNGDNGNGNGNGNKTTAGYDYTLLPNNVKITGSSTYGTSFTFTIIKIGNDFYYEEYMGTVMGIRLGSAVCLKHSGGTWTEYKMKDLDGVWGAAVKTYDVAAFKIRLNSSNNFIGMLTYDLEGTKSDGGSILGMATEKYTANHPSLGITYSAWYNTQYKLCLKYTYGSSAEVLVTGWDTSITGFGGITLP